MNVIFKSDNFLKPRIKFMCEIEKKNLAINIHIEGNFDYNFSIKFPLGNHSLLGLDDDYKKKYISTRYKTLFVVVAHLKVPVCLRNLIALLLLSSAEEGTTLI